MGRSVQEFLQWLRSVGAPSRSDIPAVDYIVIGIGNPGSRYANTRHNIGFLVADGVSGLLHERQVRSCRNAAMVIGNLGDGTRIVCAKPSTYVNRTGRAVRELIRICSGSPSRCLVVVDDFNLELGKIRLRRSGSDGGHNGLKSIAAEIGAEFPRLRVGIGPVPLDCSHVDFVLGEFLPEEKDRKDNAVARAVEAVQCFCERGVDAAMNVYNR